MDSVILPPRACWLLEVRLSCRRTALAQSLDSLYTRHTHPPPTSRSPPPFPSLVQEGWTLEETPTGALTPPTHTSYTHTHVHMQAYTPAHWLSNSLWLWTLHIPLAYYNSLLSLFSPCFFVYFALNIPNPFFLIFLTLYNILKTPYTISANFSILTFIFISPLTPLAIPLVLAKLCTQAHTRSPQCTVGSVAAQARWTLSTPWDNYPPCLAAPCPLLLLWGEKHTNERGGGCERGREKEDEEVVSFSFYFTKTRAHACSLGSANCTSLPLKLKTQDSPLSSVPALFLSLTHNL